MSDRPALCFVDDDVNELKRFAQAFGDRFCVVAATSPEECLETLRAQRRGCDLWVLDLYFPKTGVENTAEQRQEMNERFAKVMTAQREFDTFLESLGQGPAGGLDILRRVRGLTPDTPALFLSRKGTLADSVRCRDAGAVAVVPKPKPAGDDASVQALDRAMLDAADDLAERFEQAMRGEPAATWPGTSPLTVAIALLTGLVAGALLAGWLL